MVDGATKREILFIYGVRMHTFNPLQTPQRASSRGIGGTKENSCYHRYLGLIFFFFFYNKCY